MRVILEPVSGTAQDNLDRARLEIVKGYWLLEAP